MNAYELLREIERAIEENDETGEGRNIEVLLAVQPGYPFEHHIGEVVTISADDDDDDARVCPECGGYRGDIVDEDDELARSELPFCYCDDDDDASEVVLYIGEAGQKGYLSARATRALGFGRY